MRAFRRWRGLPPEWKQLLYTIPGFVGAMAGAGYPPLAGRTQARSASSDQPLHWVSSVADGDQYFEQAA